jgi:predicted DNA-binding transcriptional regulator YafY
MNRTDRLHAIHEALRRAGADGITGERLADDLEVSLRTVRRDIAALQQAGAPIWAQPGPGGGYVLDASATMPPVAFTPSQAVAVAVALTVLPPGSPFAVDAKAATAKVLDTLGSTARERARALADQVWVLHPPPDPPTPPAAVRAVEQSLAERVALAITYRPADRDATRRVVEPVVLAWRDRRWYLVAHCRLRDDIRWFRLDRIEQAHRTNEPCAPRSVADLGRPPDGAEPVVA